jgi:hypothetical protein
VDVKTFTREIDPPLLTANHSHFVRTTDFGCSATGGTIAPQTPEASSRRKAITALAALSEPGCRLL